MESETDNQATGQSPCSPEPTGDGPLIANHKSPITRKKSTGPRTEAGKRRSSQNACKHGLYASDGFFRDAALALGEDPRQFQRLLKGLMQARLPADALETVLVEDIALLLWKKARLERAETAVQVCNLHKHDLQRRKQFIQVGREITDTLESEVRENGLRRTLDAPGKFEQVLSFLQGLMEMVENNEFGFHMQESLRALYGTDPTLRGAGLDNYRFKLSKMQPRDADFEEAKNLMAARLAEEIADVGREYELFLQEHVENTRAARVAATAPSHAQWAAIIRQQNALHRQLEHKIRLLEEMQERRKKEAERLAETSRSPKSAAFPNPSGGSGGGVEEPRTPDEGVGATGSLRRYPSDRRAGADPRTLGSAISRRDSLRAWRWRGHARPQCPLLPADSNLPAPPTRRFAKSQTPQTRGLRQPASPTDPPRDAQEACNQKKILNRGNELKVLLKTEGLTETTASKRTPFCAEKVAIEAKKLAFRCNHQSPIINRQSAIDNVIGRGLIPGAAHPW